MTFRGLLGGRADGSRLTGLALGLLALALIGGCGSCKRAAPTGALPPPPPGWLEGTPQADASTPRDGGTLVVRVMVEPGGLNFLDDAFHSGWVARLTRRLVVESLLDVGADGSTLEPALASSWRESAAHDVTTFTLRPDATFSDGAALTADDVVATVAAVLDVTRPTGAARSEVDGLEGCTAPDARTVECRWARPSPTALRALARLPIYEAKQLAGDWAALARAPVGTGPYRLGAWERGVSLTLEKRDGATAHLSRIVFRFVKDHTVAGALLEKGEFDLMTNVQPSLWRAMESSDAKYAWVRGYRRLRTADNSFSYIAWNEARPIFADVRVRQALARLYDAALMARLVDLGLELPTSCPFLHGSDSCDPSLGPVPFAPDEARALLADAGFVDADGDGVLERDGQPLRFTFLLPGTSVRLAKLVPLYQEQLKPVGIDMEIERVEPSTQSTRVNRGDFDAVSRLWTEFDRDHDVFPYFHSSQRDGGTNFIDFSDAELDGLLEAVRGEYDVPRRRALERAVHRRLRELQPYLLMTNRQTLDLAKLRVHGLTPSVAWYDLRTVWVDP